MSQNDPKRPWILFTFLRFFYHLNPSDFVVEVGSHNAKLLGFREGALVPYTESDSWLQKFTDHVNCSIDLYFTVFLQCGRTPLNFAQHGEREHEKEEEGTWTNNHHPAI